MGGWCGQHGGDHVWLSGVGEKEWGVLPFTRCSIFHDRNRFPRKLGVVPVDCLVGVLFVFARHARPLGQVG
ncbi:Uncharacterised protein [Dermatophilus congolensis]|uniref:Uncharacterized protein n=1 Tax=Dermatophilus congolensis TaxID=1863 RepID=A0AA46BNT7_9MICO|nr:Uncharacterised protein [Dermatophilus congolensis]